MQHLRNKQRNDAVHTDLREPRNHVVFGAEVMLYRRKGERRSVAIGAVKSIQ